VSWNAVIQEFIRQIKVNSKQYDIADISLLQKKALQM